MSRLTQALDRLDLAIARLEASAEARERRFGDERGRLTSELQNLRSGHVALQAEARSVSSRLDSVIGRLKFVLEG